MWRRTKSFDDNEELVATEEVEFQRRSRTNSNVRNSRLQRQNNSRNTRKKKRRKTILSPGSAGPAPNNDHNGNDAASDASRNSRSRFPLLSKTFQRARHLNKRNGDSRSRGYSVSSTKSVESTRSFLSDKSGPRENINRRFAGPNAIDSRGLYFHKCCLEGNVTEVESELHHAEAKSDELRQIVNFVNRAGQNPLHAAVAKGHFRICELLLEANANVKAQDNYGFTPLHYAVTNPNSFHLVALLLANGAPLDAYDNKRRFPVRLAVEVLFFSTKQEKDEQRDDYETWLRSRTKILEEMLKYGLNLDAQTVKHRTLVHLAAYNNRTDLLQFLVEHGADINAGNKFNKTALMIAVQKHRNKMAEALLELGADIAKVDFEGKQALHYATIYNNFDIARSLINAGANVNACTSRKYTPLHYLCLNAPSIQNALEFSNLISFMLDNDANVNAQTTDRDTPLSLAVKTELAWSTKEEAYYNKLQASGYSTHEQPIGQTNVRPEITYKQATSEYKPKSVGNIIGSVGLLKMLKLFFFPGEINTNQHERKHHLQTEDVNDDNQGKKHHSIRVPELNEFRENKLITSLLTSPNINNRWVAWYLISSGPGRIFQMRLPSIARNNENDVIEIEVSPVERIRLTFYHHLRNLNAKPAYQVYRQYPQLVREVLQPGLFNRLDKEEHKSKLLKDLRRDKRRNRNRMSNNFYERLQKSSEAFIWEQRDAPFWHLIMSEAKKSGHPELHPVGIQDIKSQERYVANVFPCIVLIGETLADLGLSITNFGNVGGLLSLLGIASAGLSLPVNVYLLWSSHNYLSDFALREGTAMLLMIMLSDISDSFYLNAVGTIDNAGTLTAGLFPIIIPGIEIFVKLAFRPDHVASDVTLLQCVNSFLIIVFHATVFQMNHVFELDGILAADANATAIINDNDVISQTDEIVLVVLATFLLLVLIHTSEFATIVVSPKYEPIELIHSLWKKCKTMTFLVYLTFLMLLSPLFVILDFSKRSICCWICTTTGDEDSVITENAPVGHVLMNIKTVDGDSEIFENYTSGFNRSWDITRFGAFKHFRSATRQTLRAFLVEHFGFLFGPILFALAQPILLLDYISEKGRLYAVFAIISATVILPATLLIATLFSVFVVLSVVGGVIFSLVVLVLNDSFSGNLFAFLLFVRMIMIGIFAVWDNNRDRRVFDDNISEASEDDPRSKRRSLELEEEFVNEVISAREANPISI